MGKTYSPRGFATYDQFRDSHGNRVRVSESSAALVGNTDGPFLWVWCQHPTATKVVDNTGTTMARDESMHLTTHQARRLRDAIDAWLEDRDGDEVDLVGLRERDAEDAAEERRAAIEGERV